MDPIGCPDDSELLVPALDEGGADEVQAHVEGCPHCRQRLDRLRAEVGSLRRVAEVAVSRSRELSRGDRATLVLGSQATASSDGPLVAPWSGTVSNIGKYVVAGLLGEGGQARVYRAVHPGLNKELVLKVSRRPVARQQLERDRLVQEARLLADLDHPNLARVYDVDFWEDRPFIAMEYVRGRTLADWLRHERPDPRQAADLVAQLARALGAAHQAGIVHLDLKPSNVMIDEAGRPRILDFGLARMCQPQVGDPQTQSIGGTPGYMAPEQARADEKSIGPASDIFALGSVLYEMLVGWPPFQAAAAHEAVQKARRCEFDALAIRRTGAPRALERICLKALAADPAQRPRRAEDFAADLERFVHRSRRRKRLIASGLAVLGLLLATGYFQLSRPSGFPTGPQRVIAQVQREQMVYDLLAALPLRSGDQMFIDCPLPRGFDARLYSCDLDGKWEEYSRFTMKRGGPFDRLQADVRWPAPSAGTRLVLVCGGRSGPVQRVLFEDQTPWETLPDNLLLWMDRDGVHREDSRKRGFEPARGSAVVRVEERLERLRRKLRESCDYFAGVAYPQTGEKPQPGK